MSVQLTKDTVFDGFLELTGGVNSGWVPVVIPNDTLSFAWNCTLRGGFVTHRPGRKRLTLDYGTNSILVTRFGQGRFQEAEIYQPDSGDPYFIVAVSGRLFRVTPGDDTATVTEITISHNTLTTSDFVTPVLNGTVTVSVQSTTNITANVPVQIGNENFTVSSVDSATQITLRNDDAAIGETIPSGTKVIFWDVNPATRPQSWMVQAEKWLIVQDGQSVPIIWNGAQAKRSVQTLQQIQAGKMMAYHLGRITKVNPDGRTFSIGDLVYSGTSGTSAEKHRDAVLYVKENTFLAGGGFFTVPGNYGSITFLKGVAILDTSLGQGPLQVGTTKAIFSCDLPVDRTTWQALENPILTVSQINNGGTSQNSAVLANGDLFYRAPDTTIRSLVLGIREFKTSWGNVPVSREMNRILPYDDRKLLRYASGAVFDNRLLMTCSPSFSNRGAYHRSLAVLDFDVLSSMRGKEPAAWDGIWLGVNTLKILTGEFDNTERCFEFVLTGEGNIQLWELTTDEIKDRSNVPIFWAFETAAMFREGPNFHRLDIKRLLNGELFIDDLKGRVDFRVYFKPDQHPCWIPWRQWYVCATESSCSASTEGCVTNTVYDAQYRRRLPFGQPPDTCDTTTGKPYRDGGTFQVRIEVMGHCRITGLRLMAALLKEPFFGDLSKTCVTDECYSQPTSVTNYYNDAQTATASCPVGLPYGDDVSVTIEAGTFVSTTSKEEANTAALAAAQIQANAQLVCCAADLVALSTFTATAASDTQIDLAWTYAGTGQDGFKIYRKLLGGEYSLLHTADSGDTSYSDTGLDPETTYYYKIFAYSGDCEGDASEANATTQATVTPRSFTAGFELIKSSNQSIANNSTVDVTWDTADYDTDSFWASGSDITVPADYDGMYMQFFAGIRWEAVSGTTERGMYLRKNGTLSFDGAACEQLGSPASNSSTRLMLASPPILVATGDVFKISAYQNSGSAKNILVDDNTFFIGRVIPPFEGCLLVLTGGQSISDDTLTYVDWDSAVIDTNSYYNAGNPSRITIPAGVSKVRLYAGTQWATGTGGARFLNIDKDGGSFVGGGIDEWEHATLKARQNISSAVVSVAEGNYFEVQVRHTDGSPLDIEADGPTYFAMEVLE